MTHPQTSSKTFIFFFAVKEEAAPFRGWLREQGWNEKGQTYTQGETILDLCVTGMGKESALSHCKKLLANVRPSRVYTCGFAGALNPKLRVGEVLMEDETTALPVFFCSDHVVRLAEEKASLYQTTHCEAVEMESGIIRQECTNEQIPCTTVRAISDTAEQDLPLDFGALSRPDGKLSLPRLTCEILLHLWKIPALIQLGKNSSLAARQLAKTLGEILTRSQA